jgi:ankyrin repeat protein
MSNWYNTLIPSTEKTVETAEPVVELPIEEETKRLLDKIFAESAYGNVLPWIDAINSKKIPYDQFDSYGYTVLHVAAWSGDFESVSNLLDKISYSVDIRSQNKQTPLMLASAKGYLNIIKLLLERGADLEVRDSKGMTCILCAAHHGQIPAVYILRHRGADITAKDAAGTGAMQLAASKNHVSMMRVLKSMDLDLQSANYLGLTPLHKASENNCLESIEYLLFEGVNKHPADKNGKTPSTLALEKENDGAGDLISNYRRSRFFYKYFTLFYFIYWSVVYVFYYSEVMHTSIHYLFMTLMFNMSVIWVLPIYL